MGTTSSRFDRPILGTLAPLAGLSQLQTLNLSGRFGHPMKFEGQILNLCGNNRELTGLVETGDLQPLQNLNLLTKLNLRECENLIGQSVSDLLCGYNFALMRLAVMLHFKAKFLLSKSNGSPELNPRT